MDRIVGDIRHASRRLLRNPGFSAVILVTLALGIGANTAIFSVVNGVLLRPLPYREPAQLATVYHYYPSLELEAGFAVPSFRDLSEQGKVFEAVAVQTGWGVNVTGVGEPQRLAGQRVSGDFFRVYGVPAALGRTLLPSDGVAGNDNVVVLSDGLWRGMFGSRPDVIGTSVRLNGESYQIIGVMPPGHRDFFSRTAELWSPLVFTPEQYGDDRRTNEFLTLSARLGPGVTMEQAEGAMTAFGERLKQDNPDSYPANWTLRLKSLTDQSTEDIRPALLVLLGAVGFVLLIACANVANLLLARAATRGKEIAIRSALGANRSTLIRQLLTESLMLSLGGGILGLVLAYLGIRALIALNPANLPRVDEIGIDVTVLVFTFAVAVVTGLIFGLVPAMRTSRADLQGTLKEGGRSLAESGGQRVRRVLVVAEVALALTLLIGAGLLIRSFVRLQGVDPGFDPQNLVTMNLSLPQSKYASDTARIAFFETLFPRLEALPGVRGVAATSVIPFGGGWSTGAFAIEGFTPADGEPNPWGDIRVVNPDFHAVMKIPLVRGRAFTDADRAGTPDVAIVDEEMVRRYWPDEDPIGKRLTFGDPDGDAGPDSLEWINVIGVVGHTAHEGLDADPRIQLYLPYRQQGPGFLTLAIRTARDPLALVSAMRRTIREVDPEQPVAQIRTMESMLDDSVGQRRLSMLLLGLFAGIAMLLASVGIYGVMSFDVTRRSQELGVRMALGADRRRVLSLVMRDGLRLTILGVVIGLLGALALTQLIRSQLYGVGTTDAATYILVALLLTAVAVAATLLPALRATQLDPVVALRAE
ncbi:MAG: ABC transporter permease [Gemmatimonadaceae bacterium]